MREAAHPAAHRARLQNRRRDSMATSTDPAGDSTPVKVITVTTEQEPFPTLEEAVAVLNQVAGTDLPLDGSTVLATTDIDSLDILEWAFRLGLADDALRATDVRSLEESATVQTLYALVQTALS
jgi:hypothetical protein